MDINPYQLGVKVKGTDTVWAIQSIDYTNKRITYYSFGQLVTLSFDDAQLVVDQD